VKKDNLLSRRGKEVGWWWARGDKKQNARSRVKGERKKRGDKKKTLERKGASSIFTNVICK
jgi:hypothetical protein